MTITATLQRGRILAERLGLTAVRQDGRDLRVACVHGCGSADNGHIDIDNGVYGCWSCGKGLSAWDLCKVVLRDHEAAKRLMIDVGLFEDRSNGNGNGNGHTKAILPPLDDDAAYFRVCELKRMPPAAVKAYGGKPFRGGVQIPMWGPELKTDSSPCSYIHITPNNRKGMYAKGKPAGLFLPGRSPEPGESWLIVEGPKDAAVLFGMGYLAAGLPGNHLPEKFSSIFKDVDVALIPDADQAGWEGARKSATVLRGVARSVKIAQLPCETQQSGGWDVRDILREFGDRGPDAIRRAINEAQPAKKFTKKNDASAPIDYAPVTCAELMVANLQIVQLVKDLIVACQPMIVSGPKKSLKTSLLIALALSLATGILFLEKFSVHHAVTVCIMTGESGLATIKEIIARIAATMEIDPYKITNLFISEQLPQFASEEHIQAVDALLKSREIKVLVIDPAYMCIDGNDAGNLFIQGAQLRTISAVCRLNDCTMILAHHSKKNLVQPYAPPELEDIAWSGFQEFARQWLLINRRERYIPGTGSHKLWLSAGGSAGHGGLWGLDIEEGSFPDRFWNVHIIPYADVKQSNQEGRQKARADALQTQIDDDRKLIVQAAVKYPVGESKSIIRNGTGLNSNRFNRAFATLLDDSTILSIPILKGNHKTPRDGYKLKEA